MGKLQLYILGPYSLDAMLTHLADLKAKDFFKVGWLADEQQVEGPAPAEVGHNNGIDWHGGEEVSPRGFKFLPQKVIRY